LIPAFLLVGAAACVPPPYEPPTASEPHAILKLRRVYETTAGTRLGETCDVNGTRALAEGAASALAKAPRVSAILVHPIPAKLHLINGFSHTELRTVTEAYTVQEPYTTMESYSCGTGTSFQTCTRTVTQYRTETRYRTVLKNVVVSDGSCGRTLYFAPVVGHVYLVDFTYREADVCSATCIEQVGLEQEDGTFQTRPCPRPSAAQIDKLDDE
jgi:hypothetical protein